MTSIKKAAAKADVSQVSLAVVGEEAAPQSLVIRKKEFIQRVVTESGAKRSDVRVITDAVLKVLGEALSSGEALVLPPLGRARIARQIDKSGGEVLVIKLRRNAPGEEATDGETDGETDGDGADDSAADEKI